ncbi:MAG: phospho-sugar mutase, partial [Solirubrobacterales bacterium]
GKEGQEKIKKSLDYLRHSMSCCLGKIKIIRKADYKLGIEKDLINIIETKTGLPSSDTLKFTLEDGSWFVVRPSGTEPKMKIYLSVKGTSHKDSEEKMNCFEKAVMDIIHDSCS